MILAKPVSPKCENKRLRMSIKGNRRRHGSEVVIRWCQRFFCSPLRDSTSPLNSVAPNEKKTSGTQGTVWEKRVPFVTSPILGRPGRLIDREKHGTGDNDNNSVNGTRIFHWEVSTGKTGLPFQEFRLFRKISSGTNQKLVFHLQPDRNVRNFLVNGKRSFSPVPCLSRSIKRPGLPRMGLVTNGTRFPKRKFPMENFQIFL